MLQALGHIRQRLLESGNYVGLKSNINKFSHIYITVL